MEHAGHANKETSKGGRTEASDKTKPVSAYAADPIRQLQQSLGNRALARMIQAKLTIGRPGDVYEQEADRVAEQVMRMPIADEHLQSCSCSESAQTEKISFIQREAATAATPEVTPRVESDIGALKNGGTPLSESARAFFEPRFGYDFSHVRIHDDTRAAQTAQAINARAFTTGRDIVFGTGEYSPDTGEGKRLLAHELTHVVQQSQTTGGLGRFDVQRLGVPSIQRFEAGIHEEAERTGLMTDGSGNIINSGRGFTVEETSAVYFGNWMRDINQFFVPAAQEFLSSNAVWAIVSYLAVHHFGRDMTSEQFGYYIPAEHIDNPGGLTNQDDILPKPPNVTGAQPTTRPAAFDTLQESVEPSGNVLGKPLFSADQTGVMAHIRRTNLHVERRLELAALTGRNPEGMMHFGAAMHAIQDLFAHSNWAEIAVGHLLSTQANLLPSLTGDARKIFNYSTEVNISKPGAKPSMRPVLTTGTFTGEDTKVSIASVVEHFLREGWEEEPANNAEREAQKKFTLAMIKDSESQLRGNTELSAGIRHDLSQNHVPNLVIDAILNAPYAGIYTFTHLPFHIPDKVRLPIQRRIRHAISQVLKPVAARVQAQGLDARVADTSLIQYLADNERTAKEKTGEKKAAAERHVKAMLDTPNAVIAGPSHSQISKDHSNSPFFGVAFAVAVEAVRRLRDKMLAAWEQQSGGSTQPFNFEWNAWPKEDAAKGLYHQTRHATVKAANESLQRGRQIIQQGGDSDKPYNLQAMRHESAEQFRAAAKALLTVANAPNQAASGLLNLVELDREQTQILTERVQNQIKAAAEVIKQTGKKIDGVLELSMIATELNTYANKVESATTHAQREQAVNDFRAIRQRIIDAFASLDIKSANSRMGAFHAAERVVPIILLDNAFQSVDVTYSSLQHEVLQGKASIPNHPVKDLQVEEINLPDPSKSFNGSIRSVPVQELIKESRTLMSHPYEDAWWKATVTNYINTHKDRILTDIEARNEGYSFLKHTK
ncbi:DUF4157 domain-containing protein [Paenibacillus sp. PR3]|uniref:DUF4157 domain-containing protein n=1 Tax=Paenibacillus terricola TaxID=2763503 RepID=A0ABR8MWD5_9BACL|nr:DUF4157 domain-containing protein [Paenibacillus terricola]MBD3918469.1 DUF4157 domain-containing protein [Paenibacillus terricola]